MHQSLKFAILAASAVAGLSPAQAVILAPGSSGLVFTQFSTVAPTQGTQIAFKSVTGTAAGFEARLLTAVYRNTLGTLDFYYQTYHTGAGSSSSNDEIVFATAGNFGGFVVDAFITPADPDGAGPFGVVFNPLPVDMATTRVGLSASGEDIQVNLHAVGLNGLIEGENTATWIFRTNARHYTDGNFGLNGMSGLSLAAYAPGVPEPASWAMMIAGFGLVGGAMRGRRPNIVSC
jgi:hypothetical protein